jgi:hypothetical protein
MLPDVSQDELEKLAPVMTLRYGFLGLPHGGAKAGVLREMAEDVALTRFDEVKRRAEQPSAAGRGFSAGIALYRAGWVPARLMRPLSKGYFNDRVP